MKNFAKNTKLNTITMMHLIYETGKNEITSIIDAMDRCECEYNKDLAELYANSIIFELCRYELYSNNKKENVDCVLDKVYEQYTYNIKSEKKEEYLKLIEDVVMKMNEIFSQSKLLAPKENFVYRLFLELLHIKESSIKSVHVQSIAYLAQRWVLLADGINKSYSIESSSSENTKNDSIDYRF